MEIKFNLFLWQSICVNHGCEFFAMCYVYLFLKSGQSVRKPGHRDNTPQTGTVPDKPGCLESLRVELPYPFHH